MSTSIHDSKVPCNKRSANLMVRISLKEDRVMRKINSSPVLIAPFLKQDLHHWFPKKDG